MFYFSGRADRFAACNPPPQVSRWDRKRKWRQHNVDTLVIVAAQRNVVGVEWMFGVVGHELGVLRIVCILMGSHLGENREVCLMQLTTAMSCCEKVVRLYWSLTQSKYNTLSVFIYSRVLLISPTPFLSIPSSSPRRNLSNLHCYLSHLTNFTL